VSKDEDGIVNITQKELDGLLPGERQAKIEEAVKCQLTYNRIVRA